MPLKESICINNMHVGTLKKYLENFPDDARCVIIRHTNKAGYTSERLDLQIAINFEHQMEKKEVQFLLGMPVVFFEQDEADEKEGLKELAEKKYSQMEKWNEGGSD